MAALHGVFSNVIRQIGIALNNAKFQPLNLKPLQAKCLEYILEGKDGWEFGIINTYKHV